MPTLQAPSPREQARASVRTRLRGQLESGELSQPEFDRRFARVGGAQEVSTIDTSFQGQAGAVATEIGGVVLEGAVSIAKGAPRILGVAQASDAVSKFLGSDTRFAQAFEPAERLARGLATATGPGPDLGTFELENISRNILEGVPFGFGIAGARAAIRPLVGSLLKRTGVQATGRLAGFVRELAEAGVASGIVLGGAEAADPDADPLKAFLRGGTLGVATSGASQLTRGLIPKGSAAFVEPVAESLAVGATVLPTSYYTIRASLIERGVDPEEAHRQAFDQSQTEAVAEILETLLEGRRRRGVGGVSVSETPISDTGGGAAASISSTTATEPPRSPQEAPQDAAPGLGGIGGVSLGPEATIGPELGREATVGPQEIDLGVPVEPGTEVQAELATVLEQEWSGLTKTRQVIMMNSATRKADLEANLEGLGITDFESQENVTIKEMVEIAADKGLHNQVLALSEQILFDFGKKQRVDPLSNEMEGAFRLRLNELLQMQKSLHEQQIDMAIANQEAEAAGKAIISTQNVLGQLAQVETEMTTISLAARHTRSSAGRTLALGKGTKPFEVAFNPSLMKALARSANGDKPLTPKQEAMVNRTIAEEKALSEDVALADDAAKKQRVTDRIQRKKSEVKRGKKRTKKDLDDAVARAKQLLDNGCGLGSGVGL